MKIYLTGHKGFIGSHLLPKLLELGHEVLTPDWYDPFWEWREWAELVIHLAATTNITHDFLPEIYENNVLFAKEIMSAKCKVIYASSISAKYLTSPYAYTKRYLEYLGEKHGNAVGLRFHNVYGKGDNKGLIKHLIDLPNGADIVINQPHYVRDYIYIDDVVNYIISCIEMDAGVYEVGTGTGVRTHELVKSFMDISGKTGEMKYEFKTNMEPSIRISNNIVPHISLKEGLIKTLN